MSNSEQQANLGTWFRAGLITFALFGTIDWALALSSSTGVGPGGLALGWVVFVSLWVLGGALWAQVSGFALWAATGHATASPIMATLSGRAQTWWGERHDERDIQRLANVVVASVALVIFAAGSISMTGHLIATRNGPLIIAATSFIGQIVLALALIIGAISARRLLLSGLLSVRKFWWPRWLHTPLVLALTKLVILTGALFALITYFEIFLAVEGPSLLLAVGAVALHPPIAYLLDKKWQPSKAMRRASWAIPALCLLLVGLVSQQSDARRLIVLHGETAHFAFNSLQRHVDLDQFFRRSDCPPLGPDGLPPGGMSNADYQSQCLDPAYDRPFARTEIPEFERPHIDGQPSFLFITWDSVRVDRLGYMGHHRDTTPHIDAFAEKSLVFENAFAADSGTGPSFWSLMAGKTPFQLKLTADRFPPVIDDSEIMLGQVLEEAGYTNEAVLCATVFEREYWGIRWGFQRFENVCGNRRSLVAPTVTEEALSTLERLSNSEEPFFLWVHYWDPHTPYTHHPDIGYGEGRTDRYDEELRYTDRHTQKLLEAAEKLQQERPLYTIFGADHGENFGEHGSDPHARNLYRIVTQVPKIIHGPGIEPGRIQPPVALNDLFPTVLDLAEIDIPETSTMVSQLPVLFGAEPDAHRMVFQENSYSRPRRHTRAVIYDRYHYIMDLTTNTNEFYDYIDDPLERNNLIGAGLIEERITRQALLRFLQTSQIPEGLLD